MKYHDISKGKAPKAKALKNAISIKPNDPLRRIHPMSGNEHRKLYAERNSPKSNALSGAKDFSQKKEEIRERIKSYHPEPLSERSQHIKDVNERSRRSGMEIVARFKHEYKTGQRKRPTIDDRRRQIADYSRER